MIFAVLGAIKGDLDALQQALDQVDAQGILVVLQSGDVAVGKPQTNEVIALLRARKVYCVQGERDRELIRFARKPQSWRDRWDELTLEQMSAAGEAISSQHLEWINSLPRTRHLELEGRSVCLCHGTPSAQAEILSPALPQSKFERVRELDPADIILCGGAEASFARLVAESLVCGIGPLRGEDEQVRVCVVSTEGEVPRMEELVAAT